MLKLNTKFFFSSSQSSRSESEADESSFVDTVDGSSTRLLPDVPIVRHRGTRGANGTTSTHSLNEADLQVHI